MGELIECIVSYCMRAIKEDPTLRKVNETHREFKDTEGFDWIQTTELAIDKRKFLLKRLFVTQSIPVMKTRPTLKCYTVFVLIKSCISATYVVSRPEFDGSY